MPPRKPDAPLPPLTAPVEDYLKEVATAKPAFGPPPRENKKVANPAKEAKFDKKTAFVPVSDRQFEIPTVKFFILESEHFAVFYEHASNRRVRGWQLRIQEHHTLRPV